MEIKTVNNRFKDYRFKMGSALSSQEFELRSQLEKNFKRGTFDVAVTPADPEVVEAGLGLSSYALSKTFIGGLTGAATAAGASTGAASLTGLIIVTLRCSSPSTAATASGS